MIIFKEINLWFVYLQQLLVMLVKNKVFYFCTRKLLLLKHYCLDGHDHRFLYLIVAGLTFFFLPSTPKAMCGMGV